MTGKLKTPANLSQFNKYEIEVEKLRNENKWMRLREYSTTIAVKDQKSAESELENYLFTNPIIFPNNLNGDSTTSTTSTAQAPMGSQMSVSIKNTDTLYNVEQILKDIIIKTDKRSICIEASILLTKLLYSQTRYEDSFKQLASNKLQPVMVDHINKLKQQQQSNSEQFQPKADTLRQLQLFAEAHSIKGLCIEKKRVNYFATNPNYKFSDEFKQEEQDIIDSFEIASLFAIQHSLLMNQLILSQSNHLAINSSQSTNLASTNLSNTSSNLESVTNATATLTLNALNNSDDNLDLINPFYEIALQKAPLLYIKRGDLQMGMRKFRDLLLKKHIQSITSIRQVLLKKYAECLMFNIPASQYSILRIPTTNDKYKPIFKPINQDEEILLCLMISQYLASKEVMLLRQSQFKQIREYTFNNAINSLDFLLFYLGYHRSYSVLNDFYKAYLVLKECIRMKPDHITCNLLLAKLAIENLLFVDQAIDWCEKALEITSNKNLKAHIFLGCSICIKAGLQKQHASQISFYEKALESFKRANALDPADFLPLYHIAHCYSILRQINESLDYVQKALKFKPDDKDSLHLLALLLTSTKNYEEAHTVISKACALYDDYEDGSTASSSAVSGLQPAMPLVNKSATQANQIVDYWSSFESASLLYLQHTYKLNESIGKTITMLLPNDQLTLKYGNTNFQSQNLQQLLILVRILTQIGEFYLRHDKLNDAEMCCQEIALNHSMSYLYFYMKGRIHEYKEEYPQAKICYQNSLSINPYHIQSLQQMAVVLCQMQNFHLAEKMIRDAISLNSSLPDSWQILARVLDYQSDNQSAMKCYQTCLQLEATNPIIPFTSLTRIQ